MPADRHLVVLVSCAGRTARWGRGRKGTWPTGRAPGSSAGRRGAPPASTASWPVACRAAADRGAGSWRWPSGAAGAWAGSGRRGRTRPRSRAGADRSVRGEPDGLVPASPGAAPPGGGLGRRRQLAQRLAHVVELVGDVLQRPGDPRRVAQPLRRRLERLVGPGQERAVPVGLTRGVLLAHRSVPHLNAAP